tara:strand:- start:322 stop:933 length:612 start_codon:yes stop_codon:yes gene_type:complete
MNIFQLGVCQSNDDVYEYIRDNKLNPDLLVLIEPMSIHNETIWDAYKGLDCIDLDNVKLENVAITTQPTGDVSFYYHPNDFGNPATSASFEVASTDPMHLVKHGYNHNELVELKVPSTTMDRLFDKYNVTDIDLLAVDTEGMDDTILKSIDYNKFNIKTIIFEKLHIRDQNIYSFLESCGYNIVDRNYGHNGWNVLVEKKNSF